MGSATMVVYLFHGFVIKTVKALGFPEWSGVTRMLRTAGHHGRCRRPGAGAWPARGAAAGSSRSQPSRHVEAAPSRPVAQVGPHDGRTAERGTESSSLASCRVGAAPPR